MNKLNKILIGIICVIIVFPLYGLLGFFYNQEVMVNGISVSAHVAMFSSIILSVFSWFLVAWATKRIVLEGFLHSVIIGYLLVLPFVNIIGPMAAIIVGIIAGFIAFMIQKKVRK